MTNADPAKFEGTWTIKSVGSAAWAKRLRVGAIFEIKVSGGSTKFLPGDGCDRSMAPDRDPTQTEFEDADPGPQGDDPYPGQLRVLCPQLKRYILFRVSQGDQGRHIFLTSGDETDPAHHHDDLKSQAGGEIRAMRFVHGGPHGVD